MKTATQSLEELTQQAQTTLDVLERLAAASPFVFTLVMLTLVCVLLFISGRLVIRQYRKLGRARAVLVGLYVQSGLELNDAMARADADINEAS